jgi:hypothetical protein
MILVLWQPNPQTGSNKLLELFSDGQQQVLYGKIYRPVRGISVVRCHHGYDATL